MRIPSDTNCNKSDIFLRESNFLFFIVDINNELFTLVYMFDRDNTTWRKEEMKMINITIAEKKKTRRYVTHKIRMIIINISVTNGVVFVCRVDKEVTK